MGAQLPSGPSYALNRFRVLQKVPIGGLAVVSQTAIATGIVGEPGPLDAADVLLLTLKIRSYLMRIVIRTGRPPPNRGGERVRVRNCARTAPATC